MDIKFLTQLRRLAIVEGCSTLVLFGIAMPLKYFAGIPEAVKVVGMVHGLLFMALVIMCFLAIDRVPLSWKLALAGVVAAVFPFGPFILDSHLKKVAEAN
jgi:integral membrane protein